MSVEVASVKVLSNPSKFTDPFKFLVTLECASPGITGDLVWKLIYVGCADDEGKDQELDSIYVGPINTGKSQFVFEAPAPDVTKIPQSDLLEVTVVFLTCSFEDQEFIRIGYYVSNEYEKDDSVNAAKNDPTKKTKPIDVTKIKRVILQEKPRIIKFPIDWKQCKKRTYLTKPQKNDKANF
ncbi:histone chaperone ASF1 [Reticulomyxa filosa]|uniref:Histone chaperone ASF1 n=1 Tax=Reticulomyxa filosa TaxID=46433 RepID=X6MIH1_RETFI|nr:histone chaperone ASF1 [Reticulomyxa filosa]|eukprot:ETO13431.1 histone chaperone ASF1 [Reticulomyxa filosa]